MSQPFTPEIAVGLKIASDVQLAPAGERVAFVVAPIGHEETRPTSTIWIAEVSGTREPRPFSSSTAQNHQPRWSPDGRTLAFLSDRAERGTQQVMLIDAAGGEARPLTDVPKGVDQLAWAPDGQSLTFTAQRRALAGEQESASEVRVASLSDRPQVIARVPRDGGSPRILGPADGHVRMYAWSPDGTRVAVLTTPTTLLTDVRGHVRLLLLDPASHSERELARLEALPGSLDWSPDGTRLALVGETGDAPQDDRVMLVHAAGGVISTLDPGETTPQWAGWLPGGQELLLLSQERLETPLVVAREDGQSRRLPLVPEGGTVLPPLSLDGRTLALLRAEPTRPPEVWAGALDGELRRLTDLNPQLADVALAAMEPIAWRSSDGLEIQGWLLRPPGAQAGTRLPLVVDIHGGPKARWGPTFHGTWHDWGQALAAAGYAVLLPNPRGSTGRGAAFAAANGSDLGGKDFEDIMAGIDHLIAQGIADPERLGVGGWSYGGFMTAWTIGHTDRFKAAVCGAAVTNWPSKIGTTDIRSGNERNFSAPMHENADEYWECSPIRYLGRMRTPTLIVHGEADKRVPVSQGWELYGGLRELGVPTDIITYPRQQHAFHERAFQQDLLRRVVSWFQRWIPA